MPFPTTPILDTFNRADGALGANWTGTAFGDSFSPTISTNKAIGNAGGWAGAWWQSSTALFGPSTEMFCDYTTVAGANRVGLFFRGSGTSTPSGYELTVDNTSWILNAVSAGTPNAVSPTKTQAVTSGDGIGVSAIGSLFTAWYRSGAAGLWTVIQTWTDATFGVAGWMGFELESSAIAIDNIGGGSVVSGAIVNTQLLTASGIISV